MHQHDGSGEQEWSSGDDESLESPWEDESEEEGSGENESVEKESVEDQYEDEGTNVTASRMKFLEELDDVANAADDAADAADAADEDNWYPQFNIIYSWAQKITIFITRAVLNRKHNFLWVALEVR